MIVFVHGYLGFGSPVGGAEYWFGEHSAFVEGAKSFFEDQNLYFLNTRFGFLSTSKSRFIDGKKAVINMNWDGDIHLVTHSMGCAYAEGLKSQWAAQGLKIGKTIHINAHQRGAGPSFHGSQKEVIFYDVSNDLISGFHCYLMGSGIQSIRYKSTEAFNRRHKEPLRTALIWEQVASFLRFDKN